MLAELFQLSRNLQGQGIERDDVHRDFDKPGLTSYVTLKTVLNEEGKILSLEPMLEDDIPGLWTLKKGNFKFFPAIRLPNPPLMLVATDDRWGLLKNPTCESLVQLVRELQHSIHSIDLRDLRAPQAERILSWDGSTDTDNHQRLISFVKAFCIFSENPELLSKEIVRAINDALHGPVNDDLARSFLAVLVGSKKEPRKKPPYVEYKVQLCLDFKPGDLPSFTLYNSKIKHLVLTCLKKESELVAGDSNKTCALSGLSMPLLDGPYPDWSAPPVISKPLKPFSKFSEAPCNYRYRQADSDGFPIGKETADVLVGSIKTLTESFKGRAWCAIFNGKTEERNRKKVEARDVLIVYPSFSNDELAFIDLFVKPSVIPDKNDRDYIIKNFVDAAEPICKCFRERITSGNIADYLTLLLIRQISPGQIQLAYSASPSIAQFISAVDRWELSGENLPRNLRIPLPSTNHASGYGWFKPALLFPEDISRLLSRQWIRDATESTPIDGPPVGMVLDLFLRKSGVWRQTADQLLELTLARTWVLLSQAGERLHRGRDRELELWKDFYPKPAKPEPNRLKSR